MLQRQAAILPDPEGTVQARDSARLRYQQSVTRVSEWSFWEHLHQWSQPSNQTATCEQRVALSL